MRYQLSHEKQTQEGENRSTNSLIGAFAWSVFFVTEMDFGREICPTVQECDRTAQLEKTISRLRSQSATEITRTEFRN